MGKHDFSSALNPRGSSGCAATKRRYEKFTESTPFGVRLDAVVRADDATLCTNGLTDTSSFCYSHALTIITDSEENRHGGTSQEVSQEVREQEGEQAKRIRQALR
jgi:hypothetical protein